MGQDYARPFNCGLFENDQKNETTGEEAMRIRRKLEQQKEQKKDVWRDAITSFKSRNDKISVPQAPAQQVYHCEIEHENILRLSENPFDGSTRCDFGYYEQRGISVASLVQSRLNTNLLFPEEEVLKLLESVLYAESFLERKEIRHHDIYPTNIFYIGGVFKLSHPQVSTPSYALTHQRKRFSFLSPELIMELRKQTPNPPEQLLWKSDVFSLGMTMLQFCTLKPSCECYDKDTYDILKAAIIQRLELVGRTYSARVVEVIGVMLEQRFTMEELARCVNAYANEYHAMIRKMKCISQQQQQQQQQQIVQPQHPQPIVEQNKQNNERIETIPQIQEAQGLSQRILHQLQQLQQQQAQEVFPAKTDFPLEKNQSNSSSEAQQTSDQIKSGPHSVKPSAIRINTPTKNQGQTSMKSANNTVNTQSSNKTNKLLNSIQKISLSSFAKDTQPQRRPSAHENSSKNQKSKQKSSLKNVYNLPISSVTPLININNRSQKPTLAKHDSMTAKANQSSSATSKTKGESLDERVRRIINSSKPKPK